MKIAKINQFKYEINTNFHTKKQITPFSSFSPSSPLFFSSNLSNFTQKFHISTNSLFNPLQTPSHFPKTQKTAHSFPPTIISLKFPRNFAKKLFNDPKKSTEQHLLEELKKNEKIYSSPQLNTYQNSSSFSSYFPKTIFLFLFVFLIFLVAYAVVIVLFLDKSPMGRWRVINSSENNDVIDGRDFSVSQLLSFQSEGKVITKGIIKEKIENIAKEVIRGAEDAGAQSLTNIEWRVHFIHSEIPNLFVLPSGDIFVLSSILNFAPTEDQIAFALAHEIAHVYCRHGAEKQSKSFFLSNFYSFVGVYIPFIGYFLANYLANVLGKFEVEREVEADVIGLLFLSHTKYNPIAAPKLCQRLSKIKIFSNEENENENENEREEKEKIYQRRCEVIDRYIEEAIEIRRNNEKNELKLPPITKEKLFFAVKKEAPIRNVSININNNIPSNNNNNGTGVLSSVKRKIFG